MWKGTIGIPFAKKASPSAYSDLRIISNLPTLSKIFEKLLATQMHEFVARNNIVPINQCGFCQGFSTAVALATVTDGIIRARDKKLCAVASGLFKRI